MTLVRISLNEIPLQSGKENSFSAQVTLRTLYTTFKLSLRRFYYSINLQEYRWETGDYITAEFSPVKMALGQIKIQTKTSRVKADSFCSYVWFAHRFVIVKLFARGFMTQSEANFFFWVMLQEKFKNISTKQVLVKN